MKLTLTLALSFISFIALSQDRIYPLNGNADEVLNGYNGTFGTGLNAPTPTTDRFNHDSAALYFNGDAYIDIPVTGMTGPEFSVSAWLSYPYTYSNFRTWFTVGNHFTTDQVAGMGLTLSFNGFAFFGYLVDSTASTGYGIVSNGQPSPNQWYHVFCVYDSNYAKMYINGQLTDSFATASALPDYGTGPTAVIGSRSLNLSGWIGSIDDLHYYDHALSAFQVDSTVNSETNKITGTCFIDLNGDSLKDPNEPFASGINVESLSGSGLIFRNQTDSLGYFTTLADSGAVQTSVSTLGYYVVHPAAFNSQHSSFGNTDTISFALTPMPGVVDAGIALIPVTSAVPGFQAAYNLVCHNNGTDTVSGTITLIMDQNLVFSGGVPAVDSISGDTMYWSYSNLAPLQATVISLQLQLPPPPVFNLGDTLNFYAAVNVTMPQPDINSQNDSVFVQQTVVASHDPNDKKVLEGNSMTTTQVNDGHYLTYVIRFQNTGTIAARYVSVLDTLSSLLDWNSFEMIYASHPYNLTIQNGNIVRWNFQNINLPDSATNAPASEGFVCYRLKPLSNVVSGDVIENTAFIYFDFNLPVITNTASTTINAVFLGTGSVSNNQHEWSFYPNPVSTNLVIDATTLNGVVCIYNSLGIKIKELKIQNRKTEIQVADFASGIYFISYFDDKKSFSGKFVKE